MSERAIASGPQTDHSTIWRRVRLLILVPLARLRFLFILAAIGFLIVRWDELSAMFAKATGWKDDAKAASGYEFFCPMHPAIIRDDNKQKCPICNMPLSRRKKEEASDDNASLPAGIVSRVQLSPYRVVLAGVKTTAVAYQPLSKDITTIGTVEFDERGLKKISARVKGRIEKLIVNETGHLVKAKEALAEVYSADYIVTVESLLNARDTKNADAEQSARERLIRWGIEPPQIAKIIADGRPIRNLTIMSPIEGHVLKKYAVEGQYVEEGSPLYDIADIKTVWVQAQLYEDDLAFLPKGTHDPTSGLAEKKLRAQATARAFPGRVFEGTLSFVFPHLDPDSRTLAVRFVLDNKDHELRPGLTTSVRIHLDATSISELPIGRQLKMQDGKVLAVPERCVIDTGDRKIVYRETVPTQYEGVEVTLGPRMNGPGGEVFYPVLDDLPDERARVRTNVALIAGGLPMMLEDAADNRAKNMLKPDDLLVTNGSFLIDAETRLNPALGSIYIGGSGSKSAEPPVRPSTPGDDIAKFEKAIKSLTQADQPLARAQKFCAYQQPNSLLGTMGPIQKIEINGTPVFLCCPACINPAKAEPDQTLARALELRKRFGGESKAKK